MCCNTSMFLNFVVLTYLSALTQKLLTRVKKSVLFMRAKSDQCQLKKAWEFSDKISPHWIFFPKSSDFSLQLQKVSHIPYIISAQNEPIHLKILWWKEWDSWKTETAALRSSSNSWEEGTCVCFLDINKYWWLFCGPVCLFCVVCFVRCFFFFEASNMYDSWELQNRMYLEIIKILVAQKEHLPASFSLWTAFENHSQVFTEQKIITYKPKMFLSSASSVFSAFF